MAPESGPAVLLAQQAIEVAANAQLALNASKRQLGEALGALVGSRVNLYGYPREATLFTDANEETGRPCFVSAPVYSLRATPEERQPRTLDDCLILAIEDNSLVAAVADNETPLQSGQIVAYRFSLANILGVTVASDDAEIAIEAQQHLQINL